MAIFRKAVFGSGEAEPVLVSEELDFFAVAVTPDGEVMVYAYVAPSDTWATSKKANIGVVNLQADTSHQELIETEWAEFPVGLSPDGHWLLYSSTESGREELYATPFPDLGRKWQVSTEGTDGFARWRRDGAEIVFDNNDSLYAVAVETREDQVILGRPQLLKQDVHPSASWANFDLTSDGERLLFIEPLDHVADQPISVVLNWMESLHRGTE